MRFAREVTGEVRNLFLFLRGAADVQLVQLLLSDFAGSAHQDILRVLVHRERDDLADGILT